MNIIADIAGRYDELLALLAQMPKGEKVVAVGDIIDRGPKSREVLDYFMAHPEHIVLLGNHEHMMIECHRRSSFYEYGVWTENGGNETLDSMGVKHAADIPKKYVDWCQKLPLFHKNNGCFISHAPLWNSLTLQAACRMGAGFKYYGGVDPITRGSIIWNRFAPKRREVFQVHGHCAGFDVIRHEDVKGEFAINIDASRSKKLTGLHWPSMEIFQQNYYG